MLHLETSQNLSETEGVSIHAGEGEARTDMVFLGAEEGAGAEAEAEAEAEAGLGLGAVGVFLFPIEEMGIRMHVSRTAAHPGHINLSAQMYVAPYLCIIRP